MLLEISTVAGLPIHALVVHFSVILIPLAAVGVIAAGWRQEWRRVYLLPLLLIAAAGALAAIVAALSGEELEETVRHAAEAVGTRARFGEHPEDGELARNVAILFAAVVAAFYAIETWVQRYALPRWSARAAYGLSSCAGVAAIITTVLAGHSGAVLVWRDVGNFVSSSR